MPVNQTLRPKFITTYETLLHLPTNQLKTVDQDSFWNDLFSLQVDRPWLSDQLRHLSQEDCMGKYKPFLNLLCRRSLAHFSQHPFDSPVRVNALETLVVFVRCLLGKQMSGWEIMDVFAGGVAESDSLFANLTKAIDSVLNNEDASVQLRHRTLQLGLVFMCGVNQLSPGAYFLRRDIFPSLASMILSPKTERFTFEITLFISILSNFHRSDAAKTNPYLNRIKQSTEVELMKKIAWAIAYAAQRATSAYQEILDDSPPTFASSISSFVTALRPDRALSATPVDPPRELFKNQPIEAAVVLLSLHDFIHYNKTFKGIFTEALDSKDTTPIPLPIAVLSLSSYILTHASSTSTPRALAYAQLVLMILLAIVEETDIVAALCRAPPSNGSAMRLCRQRPPYLPHVSAPRPRICAVLDCCVLWIRHNLHKRLEVLSYLICIRIVYRVIWYITTEKIRLEYYWDELWRALFTLMDFLANQAGLMKSTAKVDELAQETICLLEYAVRTSERFLPSPEALHQLVYEVVRSGSTIRKQRELLKNLRIPKQRRSSLAERGETELDRLESIAEYYEGKLGESGATSAKGVLKVLGQLVDKEGILGGAALDGDEDDKPGGYSDDVADTLFVRWACSDGLALMDEP